MIQGDLKTFVLLIFIIIAIIITLNIIFRSIFLYIIFNKLKNNGMSTTNILVLLAVIAVIYMLICYFKSKQTVRTSQSRLKE